MFRSAPLALALTVVLYGMTSEAQTATGDPQATAAYERGSQAFRERRFGEARIAFSEAVRREPTPARWFALAQACRNMSLYTDAINAFEHYLAAPEAGVAPERITEIRGQVETLRRLVGTLTLHVTPPTATASLDGHPLTLGNERIPLNPGAHVLEVSAEGHRTEHREITTESASQTVLDITLTAAVIENPRLVIEPSVASASVSIDGVSVGAGRIERQLTPGDHAIEINASGYEPFRRSVHLNTTGTTRMDAALQHRGMPGWVLPTVITGSVLVVGGTILGVWLATRDTGPDLHPAWGIVTE